MLMTASSTSIHNLGRSLTMTALIMTFKVPNMSKPQYFTLTFPYSIAVNIRIVTCLNMPIFVIFVFYVLGHVTRGFVELFWQALGL